MKEPSDMTVRQDGEWWIGWIDAMPGVNSQATTREELIENLRSARDEAIDIDKETGPCKS